MIRRFDSGDGFTTMLGAGYDAGRGKLAWRIAQSGRVVLTQRMFASLADWCCGSSGRWVGLRLAALQH